MKKYEYTIDDTSGNVEKRDNWDDAISVCWDMAIGKNTDNELVEWGDDDTGWGVCPDGDDGAYWPQVSAKETHTACFYGSENETLICVSKEGIKDKYFLIKSPDMQGEYKELENIPENFDRLSDRMCSDIEIPNGVWF